MGVTIHYRGTLDRPDAVEAVQDRVLDLALALGGRASYWYSRGEGPEARAVRGIIVELAPGCDSVSLLFSKEGRLVSLFDIEAAENGPLPPDAWVFAKTQFAPVEAHVALVGLLRFLKENYASDLEVKDEGEYWETRDLGRLVRLRGTIERALDAVEGGLRAHPLSAEAREDPEIVAARVERVARLAFETLRRPPEHAPVRAEDDDLLQGDERGGSEALWDAAYKENARKVERLVERVAREGPENMERILRELVPPPPEGEDDEEPAGEWLASEADGPPHADEVPADDGEGPTVEPLTARERDPLLARAEQLFLSLRDVPENPQADGLHAGICESIGGLAQAQERAGEELPPGLRVVQLKRALRGLAVAQGAVMALRGEGHETVGGLSLAALGREIDEISDAAVERLRVLRGRLAGR